MMDGSGQVGGFGEADAVVSDRMCVVYDPATGEIHHTHRVITLAGGVDPSDKDVENVAVSLARSARKTPDQRLEVLFTEPRYFESGKRYRVEHKTRSLIEAAATVPPPTR